ncbi:MAG: endonuclease MutS2 [Cellulosilyticaceae bacterium]
MNDYVYDKLQYNDLKQILESYCVSTLGKKLVRGLWPSGNLKVVKNRLNETTEARRLLDGASAVPLQGIMNIMEIVDKVEKDIILTEEELSGVSAFLRGCRKMQTYMKDKAFDAPTLQSYSLSLMSFQSIEEEIEFAIRNNRVCDEASKELRKVRRHIAIAESKIEERLGQFLKNAHNKQYIQEFFVTKRHGKLTIPIKAAYKNKVAGTVVESTDKTAFMEIDSVSKYSSELLGLQIEESTEIYKVLSHLTGIIYDQIASIKRNMEVIGQYDMIFAKGKYSKALEGRSPKLNEHGHIVIKGGRHPLLTGKVVPLDFEIGHNYRGLMITGPNAGGKTVVLKTVGILTLAMQTGLHIPVQEGTEMSVFDRVFVDIGDNQSIENALSTFSSHVKNLSGIINQTNPSTLLLFDEIGSGTEPSEGAALAIAILEGLYHKGAIMVATTHYNEIKDFSAKHPDFENAAMQFDSETLEPRYQLLIGKSGESNALWIARKMGIQPEILKNAESYMTAKDYNYETVKNHKVRQKQVQHIGQTSQREALQKGDKVRLLENQQEAIVYRPKDDYNGLVVFYQNEMREVDEKRVKLLIRATDLYPEDYDLDTLFSSFRERKLEHDLQRGSKKALKKLFKENKSK